MFTSEKNRRLACKLCNLNAAAFEEQISKLSKESDVPQKELASGNPHKMKRRMEKIMRRRNKERRRNTRNKWAFGGRRQLSAPPQHDWAQPQHADAAEEEEKKAAAKEKAKKHAADRDAWGERYQCKCCGANYKATFYLRGLGVKKSPVCYHCRQGIPKQVTVRAGAPFALPPRAHARAWLFPL